MTTERYRPGSRIKVPRYVRSARDMIRQHLSEAGMSQRQLAIKWGYAPTSFNARMTRTARPLDAEFITRFIATLKLDEFDAAELHRQAAREMGFRIDGPVL